jgi:hypothetical protein
MIASSILSNTVADNRDHVYTTKKRIFDYLDSFLAPDHLEYPLPKPRTIAKSREIPIKTVYINYYRWRKLHPDDFRVKAHRKKYTGEY